MRAYSSTGRSCAFSSLRVEQQGERRAGIDHVHGGDAAVAEVLLGEVQRRCRRHPPPVCAPPASGGRPGRPGARTSRRRLWRRSAISSSSKRVARCSQRVVIAARACAADRRPRRRCAATRAARGARSTRSSRGRRRRSSGSARPGCEPTCPDRCRKPAPRSAAPPAAPVGEIVGIRQAAGAVERARVPAARGRPATRRRPACRRPDTDSPSRSADRRRVFARTGCSREPMRSTGWPSNWIPRRPDRLVRRIDHQVGAGVEVQRGVVLPAVGGGRATRCRSGAARGRPGRRARRE